jgi:hypothetical protein
MGVGADRGNPADFRVSCGPQGVGMRIVMLDRQRPLSVQVPADAARSGLATPDGVRGGPNLSARHIHLPLPIS